MIGDTAYDIDAAAKADVATIALRCGGWRDEDLRGAIAIFDDPADLLAHASETPLARRARRARRRGQGWRRHARASGERAIAFLTRLDVNAA